MDFLAKQSAVKVLLEMVSNEVARPSVEIYQEKKQEIEKEKEKEHAIKIEELITSHEKEVN
jgi:hypothetical protein